MLRGGAGEWVGEAREGRDCSNAIYSYSYHFPPPLKAYCACGQARQSPPAAVFNLVTQVSNHAVA